MKDSLKQEYELALKESKKRFLNVYAKYSIDGEDKMRVICSWCGKTVSKKRGKGTTRAICKECAKKIEKGEE